MEGSAVTSDPTKCLRKLAAWSAAGAESGDCLIQERTCLSADSQHLSFKEEICEHGFSQKNSCV